MPHYNLRPPLILLSVWLFATLGCSRSAPPPAPATSPPLAPTVAGSFSSGTDSASYSYEVRDAGSAATGVAQTVDATSGKNRLQIQEGRMTVNGRSYGPLKNGDAVLVDQDGQVSVNGQIRQPE